MNISELTKKIKPYVKNINSSKEVIGLLNKWGYDEYNHHFNKIEPEAVLTVLKNLNLSIEDTVPEMSAELEKARLRATKPAPVKPEKEDKKKPSEEPAPAKEKPAQDVKKTKKTDKKKKEEDKTETPSREKEKAKKEADIKEAAPKKEKKAEAAPAKKEEAETEKPATQTVSPEEQSAAPEVEEEPQTSDEEKPKAEKVYTKTITIPNPIVLRDLAEKLDVTPQDVISILFQLGIMATINQRIDFELASLVADEHNIKVEAVNIYEGEEIEDVSDNENLTERAPVVTIMGHVDHGKTKLLDAIRSSDIVAGESGGITQHIGAYRVKAKKDGKDKYITFIDTPGHEAFSTMRARGTQITDIVILVVAADDGVMPQTVESINHSKAAGVPIIVAINKIDKPEADVERVKRQLMDYGFVAEEWGGDTICVSISALEKQGISGLLEMILLQAEMLELKANIDTPAKGVVIEAQMDVKRGVSVSLLVQKGTLKKGDYVVAGLYSGKIRNMYNDRGVKIEKSGPSCPVEVLGISGVPQAGDPFQVFEDEKKAKTIAQKRQIIDKETKQNKQAVTLENIYDKLKTGEMQELNLIIKSDTEGSKEALKDMLMKFEHESLALKIVHAYTGGVNKNDINLAIASNAIVIAYRVRVNDEAKKLAEENGIDIRSYEIIYEVMDDMKEAIEGMLKPIEKEKFSGSAEVLKTFKLKKVGVIAGCIVKNGIIKRTGTFKIYRNDVEIFKGAADSLKRYKDDVKEVKEPLEFGISFENFNDIKEGDIIECVIKEQIKQTL